jgi:hypothetical protein
VAVLALCDWVDEAVTLHIEIVPALDIDVGT